MLAYNLRELSYEFVLLGLVIFVLVLGVIVGEVESEGEVKNDVEVREDELSTGLLAS